MMLDADVLIVGGGCAGLSLATAIAERQSRLRVQILEPRQSYMRDRTWCFWNTEQHPFSAAVTHQWQSWRVRRDGAEARQRSERYTYDHLPADRFYQLATGAIEQAGHVLTRGVTVLDILERGEHCEVETSAGLLRSRWVFDSRPRTSTDAKAVLVQRFLGWHVHTAQACFDPSVVDLMDFAPVVERGRTSFFYVLPFSPTEALVEATFLDDPRLPFAEAETHLQTYLGARVTGGYDVLYAEKGELPMGAHEPPRSSSGRVIDIGARGGRIKPSSGYAFVRIQRQSLCLAHALAAGTDLPGVFEPPLYQLLDAVFLRAIERSPERASQYFLTLFRRLPADVLVRFLSETAAFGEVMRVAMSLPKMDFLQAALSPGGASAI